MTERSVTPSSMSRTTTTTSLSRQTTSSRPGTGTASVGGGSWGRKRGAELAREMMGAGRGEQGSTRGSASGGGAGTDLSSPSSRTVFSNATTSFSNSTSNSSNPNPSQQFQDALQGMKERHDLEKDALLSALTEAKRVNKELQGTNEGLEREVEALRGRIGELENYVDELEDRWSEAVFRNRVGEGKNARSPQVRYSVGLALLHRLN